MAAIYVRSTDGSNTDDGSTWALAKASIAGAAAIEAAGDDIYVSQAHAESFASVITLTLVGSLTSPVKVIGASDAAEPPTAVSTAPTVTSTGNNGITIDGNVYVYGINFFCGTGANSPNLIVNNASDNQKQVYENCTFQIPATGASARIVGATSGEVLWRNCSIKFANTAQLISFRHLHWSGGGIISGSSAITLLVQQPGSAAAARGLILLENLDLSAGAAAMNIFEVGTASRRCVIRNCKLPGSWSGAVATAAAFSSWRPPDRYSMYNCDSGDTNYKLWIMTAFGSIRDETTLVRTGGASDGTTGLSWKMASGAEAKWPSNDLITDEIVIWNDTTGSAKTVTVEILHDSATNLTDREIWLDASYLGDASYPLGTPIHDRAADILATAADQAASAETWTTTGMTNPNTQKLSVTFTPQQKGYVILTVHLAKASYTVYVCPKVTVS